MFTQEDLNIFIVLRDKFNKRIYEISKILGFGMPNEIDFNNEGDEIILKSKDSYGDWESEWIPINLLFLEDDKIIEWYKEKQKKEFEERKDRLEKERYNDLLQKYKDAINNYKNASDIKLKIIESKFYKEGDL